MTESGIYSKLSRLLETHSFDDETNFDEFLRKAAEGSQPTVKESFGTKNAGNIDREDSSPNKSHKFSPDPLPNRATPFEMWQSKQKSIFVKKEPKKLSENQRDAVAANLHQTSKRKESAVLREQNNGLKSELAGHEFKPRPNKLSFELSKSMKPLLERYPGLEQQKEEALARKREEAKQEEMKECSFTPARAKMSDHYLKRMGRDSGVLPEDFDRYKRDVQRRNDQRKEVYHRAFHIFLVYYLSLDIFSPIVIIIQILEEVRAKELTFKPELNAKTRQIQVI